MQVSREVPYIIPMKQECKRYEELLKKKFPIPENLIGEVYFKIKRFPHDFGEYFEVCIVYNEDNEPAIEFAFTVDNNLPLTWEE